jgi:hypothetical protein
VVTKLAPTKTEGQAREIIRTCVKNGVLIRRDYENPKTRKDAVGLYVDQTKRPTPSTEERSNGSDCGMRWRIHEYAIWGRLDGAAAGGAIPRQRHARHGREPPQARVRGARRLDRGQG